MRRKHRDRCGEAFPNGGRQMGRQTLHKSKKCGSRQAHKGAKSCVGREGQTCALVTSKSESRERKGATVRAVVRRLVMVTVAEVLGLDLRPPEMLHEDGTSALKFGEEICATPARGVCSASFSLSPVCRVRNRRRFSSACHGASSLSSHSVEPSVYYVPGERRVGLAGASDHHDRRRCESVVG